MQNRKYRLIMVVILLVLAAATLIFGFLVRNQQLALEKAGAIRLILPGKEVTVPLSRLDREEFSKEIINGKGEKMLNTYRGIELKTLLQEYETDPGKVNGMTVAAADQFTAEYTGDEIRESGRIWLVVASNGKALEGMDPGQPGVWVIVFGDPDMRRTIRNPIKVEIK